MVYSKNLMGVDGSVWSTAQIYYSSANNGTNCAVLVAKKWAGIKHEMGINLAVVGRTGVQSNSGQFAWYAGPVVQTNTNGHCVVSEFREGAPNGSSWSEDVTPHVACG
ncbi:hypothetical protein [Streptomyces sp. NRRL B-24572]|uniref:hypothetical protein n=1 Tax=Streptomyces sp. NRRL B-24572 TaxID=1962156 RepID=UPI00117F1AF4|nr:hypothetical protein [Streptomyces sp. NRRL B-24572]